MLAHIKNTVSQGSTYMYMELIALLELQYYKESRHVLLIRFMVIANCIHIT